MASIALLAMTPSSWGNASKEGIAAWVIPASCLIIGLPALAIGLSTAWLIVRHTARPFRVFWPHLPFGAALLVAAYVLLLFATRIADPATYEHLRDPGGEPNTSSAGVLVMTAAVAIFAYAVLWGCAYIYAEAFSEEK
ncbi:MAG TPA: hypothetical protein VFX19_05470 [Dehalococcoidia bacterium]|jgi:hypothetical protein|nr:hypothetical protein [Dehalococcoidia bacterium]